MADGGENPIRERDEREEDPAESVEDGDSVLTDDQEDVDVDPFDFLFGDLDGKSDLIFGTDLLGLFMDLLGGAQSTPLVDPWEENLLDFDIFAFEESNRPQKKAKTKKDEADESKKDP